MQTLGKYCWPWRGQRKKRKQNYGSNNVNRDEWGVDELINVDILADFYKKELFF